MSFGSRSLVLAAVLAVTLACATGARADTFTFTYSGPDISGTATLQATSEGSGVYLVTSITGSQTLDGVTQTITGLVPTSAGNALYYYDNLIYPTQTPAIDIDGLLFTVTGESAPVNICGATTTACEYTYAEYTYGAGDSPSSAYPGYQVFQITAETLVDPVPEPASLLLLSAGLLGVCLSRRSLASHEPARL